MKKIKVECFQPPALALISGKKYVVPVWLEVPMETTLGDIKWTRPRSTSKKLVKSVVKEKYVTGSTGNEYLVKLYSDDSASCECWGFKRHKKCKHIKEVKGE